MVFLSKLMQLNTAMLIINPVYLISPMNQSRIIERYANTVHMSAGTRMMMEREQNQVYATVKNTYLGTSGPEKYLNGKITRPIVRGNENI